MTLHDRVEGASGRRYVSSLYNGYGRGVDAKIMRWLMGLLPASTKLHGKWRRWRGVRASPLSFSRRYITSDVRHQVFEGKNISQHSTCQAATSRLTFAGALPPRLQTQLYLAPQDHASDRASQTTQIFTVQRRSGITSGQQRVTTTRMLADFHRIRVIRKHCMIRL